MPSLFRAQSLSEYRDQTDVFYASPIAYLRTNFPSAVDPAFPPSPFPATHAGASPPPDNRWDHRWPSHLVFFGALLEHSEMNVASARVGKPQDADVASILRKLGYEEVWAEGNGWEEDWRRRGGVRVWRWRRPRLAGSTLR